MALKSGESMIECNLCGYKFEESEAQFECPYCGRDDIGDGYFVCENCENIIDWQGNEWECWYCQNNGETKMREEYCECPNCGALFDGDVCDECGWPDVNQGWLGEEYG